MSEKSPNATTPLTVVWKRLASNNRWTVPFLILAAIVIASFPYLFVDTLWHDDSMWYYHATEGELPLGWRGNISVLSPYLDVLYGHGMTILGLPAIRGVFVLVMVLGSILLFYLYRDTFGIDWKLAAFAATVPNILPSLKGIPIGLNASYALWGLAPIVASLLLLRPALMTTPGKRSWMLFAAAFVLYYLGLNLPGQPSSNFLIPNVLLFFVMFFPMARVKTLLYGMPFLLYGVWILYKQHLHSHRDPISIPPDIILDRMGEFLDMASFLPFNTPYSAPITGALMLLGTLGVVMGGGNSFRQPSHFQYTTAGYRMVLLSWIACWLVCNSIAYVVFSPTFRAYDYAYVFNFGAVLLQTAGIGFVASLLTRVLHLNHDTFNWLAAIALVTGLIWVIDQRIQYTDHPWGEKRYQEGTAKELRQILSKQLLPDSAQVLLFSDAAVPHTGLKITNSGYIRYLLNRNDLYALIGKEQFPANVFAPYVDWFTYMRDLDKELPTIAFRSLPDGTLKRLNHLLTTEPTGTPELPRLKWTLYDISSNTEKPHLTSSGKGLATYHDYVAAHLSESIAAQDIAFAPDPDHDEIISEEQAEILASRPNTLQRPITIGQHLRLLNVFKEHGGDDTEVKLQMLLQIDQLPPEPFKLAYQLNRTTHYAPLWDYVRAGDTLLLTTPTMTEGSSSSAGIRLGFINVGSWPYQPLFFSPDSAQRAAEIWLK